MIWNLTENILIIALESLDVGVHAKLFCNLLQTSCKPAVAQQLLGVRIQSGLRPTLPAEFTWLGQFHSCEYLICEDIEAKHTCLILLHLLIIKDLFLFFIIKKYLLYKQKENCRSSKSKLKCIWFEWKLLQTVKIKCLISLTSMIFLTSVHFYLLYSNSQKKSQLAPPCRPEFSSQMIKMCDGVH